MLFLANSVLVNGTTTFLMRIAKENLLQTGEKIDILVLTDKFDVNVLGELDEISNIYMLDDFLHFKFIRKLAYRLPGFFPIKEKEIVKLLEKNKFAVHAMGCFGLLFIQRIVNSTRLRIRITVGIYHQNEFMFHHRGFNFCHVIKKILEEIPEENFIFFNEYNKLSYSRYLGKNLNRSSVVPIGIEPGKIRKNKFSDNVIKICSVGNLDTFKSYNVNTLYVVRKLLDAGFDVKYNIFGEGELESVIVNKISSLGLGNQVKLNKRIPYVELRKKICEYDVFIGSGTAVLEAASTGIPSIIGVESVEEDMTYGFLSDINGLSYNEFIQGQDMVTTYDCILSIIDIDERQKIGNMCFEKSKEFYIGITYSSIFRPDFPYKHQNKIKFSVLRSSVSIIFCALYEKLLNTKDFSNRRDQGDISR